MTARRRPAGGQPAAKGYREAKRLRAKAYKKVDRQRQDTGRKWAKKVMRDHDVVAEEDFRPTFLAVGRSGLCGWSRWVCRSTRRRGGSG